MLVDFKNLNVNPYKRKTCDCVVRALTVAINVDCEYSMNEAYKKVLMELVNISLKTGYMINDKHTFDIFLTNHGFIKYKQPRKPDNKKYLVGEIDTVLRNVLYKEYDIYKSVCVISCANHLTVYTNIIMDTWDCRRKTIGNIWVRW